MRGSDSSEMLGVILLIMSATLAGVAIGLALGVLFL